MKFHCFSSILVCAVLSGCATDTDTKTTSHVYSPTSPYEVTIYAVAPSAPFEILGKVKDNEIYVPLDGNGLVVDRKYDVVEEMQKKAAALGANGLIVTSRRIIPPLLPISGASKDNPAPTREEATGFAIRLTKPAGQP
jgi:hypothetical protein